MGLLSYQPHIIVLFSFLIFILKLLVIVPLYGKLLAKFKGVRLLFILIKTSPKNTSLITLFICYINFISFYLIKFEHFPLLIVFARIITKKYHYKKIVNLLIFCHKVFKLHKKIWIMISSQKCPFSFLNHHHFTNFLTLSFQHPTAKYQPFYQSMSQNLVKFFQHLHARIP